MPSDWMDEIDGLIKHYDKQGNVVSFRQWALLCSDIEYRRVGFTSLGGIEISTVLIGMDMSLLQDGPPIIFETMVFDRDGEHPSMDLDMARYATLEQAQAGHLEFVERYTRLLDVDTAIVRLTESEPDT